MFFSLIGFLKPFFNTLNLIHLLICIELFLVAINIYFFFCAILFDDLVGFAAVLFCLVTAAAESALGLALIVLHFKLFKQSFDNRSFFLMF